MRFLVIAFVTISTNFHALASFQTQAQDRQARHSRYMETAEVRHLAGSITVTANDARPLAQAVTALSEEFGWAIDFEDPAYYSKYDLVDDTAPQWRDAHPIARGVTVIAGGTFQTQFPETPGPQAARQRRRNTFSIQWSPTITQVRIRADSASATKVTEGSPLLAHM
jgi:hypothetical protein